MIEDTIRRNASPVRLEAPQSGSCSSLASSGSLDEATSRSNRNSSYTSNTNVPSNNNGCFNVPNQTVPAGPNLKMPRQGGQTLLHSLSTNDASLGEYKYTVGVGQRSIKITGDCFELVRVSTFNFLKRVEKLKILK